MVYYLGMQQQLTILVVEDEPGIRQGVCDLLAFHGYLPVGVESGEEGLQRATQETFALVLLDVMLPGKNGFEICTELRQQIPEQPIIMLTAKGSEEDIVKGFRCGSDDYITKPFSVRELVARVEALLRRSGRLGQPDQSFVFGLWQIDADKLTATSNDDRCDLTRREISMLHLFYKERGRIVSRRRLLSEVWGFGNSENINTRTVDMHIAKLRKKIERSGSSPIETVRGEGYRYSG